MKIFLKGFTLSIMFFTFIFIVTGCGSKEVKENTNSVFDVEQVSDSKISITLENAKKGDSKTAKLVVGEGMNITTTSKLEGANGVTAYYYKAGTTLKKDSSDYELISGEGESTAEGFPAGDYEVLFEVDEDGVTGTIEVEAK